MRYSFFKSWIDLQGVPDIAKLSKTYKLSKFYKLSNFYKVLIKFYIVFRISLAALWPGIPLTPPPG